VRVFGEQKHPNPNQKFSKLTTKEYFERDKANDKSSVPSVPMNDQVCFGLNLEGAFCFLNKKILKIPIK